jgi:hypothetical protein
MILVVGAGEECQGSINNDVRDDKDTDPVQRMCAYLPSHPPTITLGGGGDIVMEVALQQLIFKRSFMHGRE